MDKKLQTSESLGVGMLLAFAGGFFDIYSYMARGKVFANAQTGNMVLFGLKIAEGDFWGMLYYAVPIAAFIAGVILAVVIRDRFRENSRVHWRQIVLAVELLVVLAAMCIPQGDADIVVNAAISFVCSVQVQSFRKLKGSVFATTMCTGNLRSATDALWSYRQSHDRAVLRRSVDYYIIIAVFIAGAVAGGLLTKYTGAAAVGFACLPIAGAIVMMRTE